MNHVSKWMKPAMASMLALGTSAAARPGENYDEPGPPYNWAMTLFPSLTARGGAFSRPTLAGVAGVPTLAAAPISSNGVEREGAYINAGGMGREAYALMNTMDPLNCVMDSEISSWVMLSPALGTASRTTVGVVARAYNVGTATGQAYAAVISVQPGSSYVWFRLVKDIDACFDCAPADNIIDAGDTLMGPTLVGTLSPTQNYWIDLKVATVGGSAVLTPVVQRWNSTGGVWVLEYAPALGSYTDAAPLASGYDGMVAFAPNGNQSFWDDAVITLGPPVAHNINPHNNHGPLAPPSK